MSALMAERRELGEEGRQDSLFEAPAPPRDELSEAEEIARLEAFAR